MNLYKVELDNAESVKHYTYSASTEYKILYLSLTASVCAYTAQEAIDWAILYSKRKYNAPTPTLLSVSKISPIHLNATQQEFDNYA